MKDRIRLIRKNAGLTQSEFAEKIGTVQNTITGYETGRRNPSGSAIALICRIFNVNEDWLRNGLGEMYSTVDSSDDFLSVMEEIDVQDQRARDIILNYYHLSINEKEKFWEVVDKLLSNNLED